MRTLALVAALAASLLAGPARAEGPEVIRDPEALKTLFAGRTLFARFLNGERVIEYYAPDGRSAYVQKQCLHAGKWWVTELTKAFGRIQAGTPIACFSYPTLNEPDDPACFAVGGTTGHERFYPVHGDTRYVGLPAVMAERWTQGNTETLPLDMDDCPSV